MEVRSQFLNEKDARGPQIGHTEANMDNTTLIILIILIILLGGSGWYGRGRWF
jgi:hypothetical protein